MPRRPPPPGKGRPKGSKNRDTLRKAMMAEEGLAAALANRQTPLETMLRRMRDPKSVNLASFKAACAAAPYVHPKLSAVAFKRVDAPEVIDLRGATAEELAVIARLLERGPAPSSPSIEESQVIEGLVAEEEGDDQGE